MTKRILTNLALLATALTAFVGCKSISDQFDEDRDSRIDPSWTPHVNVRRAASARPLSVQVEARNAAMAIAEARCQREDSCENVGDSKKYSSNQDCLDRVRTSWRDELSARQCPNGVNDAQLDECLAEIRAEKCDHPLDSLARIVECRTGQVCRS